MLRSQSKSILVILISFLSYYLFSKVGLLFAIPPGFASAVWPAAGVGLACYLIFGRLALIGVFLGSALANIQVMSGGYSGLPIAQQILPFIIATGTCLQMVVARYLLRRSVSLPVNNTHLRSVIKFLAIVGPIACIVAATINTTAVSIVNGLTLSHALFVGFTWWVGDFIGVMFFLPIVLSLANNEFYVQKKDKLKIAVPAAILFLLVSSIFAMSRQHYQTSRMEDFVSQTNKFSQQINLIENTITQQLAGMEGLFRASKHVTRDEFRRFIDKIMNPDINLRALAWLPKVNGSERRKYEEQIAATDFPGFKLKQLIGGNIQEAEHQRYYIPILYTEPLEPNKAAVGLDVSSHDVVGITVNKAIYTGEKAVSPQLSLVQNLEKYNAVIVYYPIYEGGDVPSERNLRVSKLLGLFEAVIELDQLVLSLYDESMADNFVFRTRYVQDEETTATFEANYRTDALFNYRASFPFFDTRIEVDYASSAIFDQNSIDWSSWLIIIIGCCVSTFSVIFIIIMTNLSEMLEQKVAHKTQQLSQKNDELMKANAAKSQFLANMSHEYRTPLNAVIGFAQIGKNSKSVEEAKSYFKQILDSSKLLLGIINNVLDFSKVSESDLKLEESPINLAQSVTSIKNLLTEKASAKGVVLEVIDRGLSDKTIIGDSVRLEQIMMNLVDNAIKFTERGTVKLTVVLTEKGNSTAELSIVVEDQGIGIPESKIPDLFMSFTQADESTTRKFGGTGLGLAIVKQLTELMNGKIVVESKLGEGTRFSISMPVEIYSSEITHAEENDDSEYQAQLELIRQQNFKALIVEDNKINQLIASKQLELLNISVTLADNGELGLEALEQGKPDILFVDLHMPVMDGFTMLEALKQKPEFDDLPAVIISASVSAEDRARAELLGINHYVTKPFLLEDLERVVYELLAEDNE
ncbi:CHASE domain-containing protein [Psychrosphaera ytuae]|uniref:histidine kinase n=1 Tax=Psychrosphaera ytuae TaxID=2820710 RepID=A0A975DDA3_9GAMM|nr:CHASE domain-containing protein [Psychrosphaera ytuae]QTH64986.1 CHASE domain-containing protein [Psychrosphaera ytuae]